MATYSADHGRPNTSISASDSNAAGDVWGVVQRPGRVGRVTMQVTEVNSGAYSALRVDLEGSTDNSKWVSLAQMSTVLTSGATGAVSEETYGYIYFRANKVSSTTSSGTPKVTATLSFA